MSSGVGFSSAMGIKPSSISFPLNFLILVFHITAGQAAVPAVYFWYSPRMSMAFSRISTFRTLPESVMGYSSTMCT